MRGHDGENLDSLLSQQFAYTRRAAQNKHSFEGDVDGKVTSVRADPTNACIPWVPSSATSHCPSSGLGVTPTCTHLWSVRTVCGTPGGLRERARRKRRDGFVRGRRRPVEEGSVGRPSRRHNRGRRRCRQRSGRGLRAHHREASLVPDVQVFSLVGGAVRVDRNRPARSSRKQRSELDGSDLAHGLS